MVDKKIFNRYDPYEICAMFSESAEEHLNKKGKVSRARFWFKAVLGIMLFVNGYLSHWGPWPWPSNYYLIAFSVVFYYTASYLYEYMSGITQTNGKLVGDFILSGQVYTFLVRFCDDPNKYCLETQRKDRSQPSVKREIVYYNYFTIDGTFLQETFKRELDSLVQQVTK